LFSPVATDGIPTCVDLSFFKRGPGLRKFGGAG
jgi:hypothetical protein